MAYPLKKVSYCTAVPKNCLFAMVTRSILDQPPDILYCHTFGLSSAEHVRDRWMYESMDGSMDV